MSNNTNTNTASNIDIMGGGKVVFNWLRERSFGLFLAGVMALLIGWLVAIFVWLKHQQLLAGLWGFGSAVWLALSVLMSVGLVFLIPFAYLVGKDKEFREWWNKE